MYIITSAQGTHSNLVIRLQNKSDTQHSNPVLSHLIQNLFSANQFSLNGFHKQVRFGMSTGPEITCKISIIGPSIDRDEQRTRAIAGSRDPNPGSQKAWVQDLQIGQWVLI